MASSRRHPTTATRTRSPPPLPLIPTNELLGDALRRGYAVGYFESWSLESLQGVVEAAEATESPIMVGFNGEFLSHAGRHAPERLSWYAALGRAAAESAAVPCALVFNECAQDAWIRKAIELGFGQVMLDDPEAPQREYLRRIKELAAYAHSRGAAIEAEMGHFAVPGLAPTYPKPALACKLPGLRFATLGDAAQRMWHLTSQSMPARLQGLGSPP